MHGTDSKENGRDRRNGSCGMCSPVGSSLESYIRNKKDNESGEKMQGDIEQVVAKRVEFALCVVESKTQVKQVSVFRREGLEIFFSILRNLGFDDHAVIEVEWSVQSVAIGEGDENENKNDQ